MIVRRLLAAFAIIASACAPHTTEPNPVVPDADGRIAFAISDAVLRDSSRLQHDWFELVAAQLQADTIVMDVRYGGGCEQHAFILVGSSAFAESSPVQTAMRLVHDGRGDACDALLSRRLRADVSPIRDAYRRVYHVDHGVIAISLGSTRLLYSF